MKNTTLTLTMILAFAVHSLVQTKNPLHATADLAALSDAELLVAAAGLEKRTAADVAALLDAGADPNARSGDGSTPLHVVAARTENPKVITALLDAGADPNALDFADNIPWDYARENEALKGTDAYWRLNDLRF